SLRRREEYRPDGEERRVAAAAPSHEAEERGFGDTEADVTQRGDGALIGRVLVTDASDLDVIHRHSLTCPRCGPCPTGPRCVARRPGKRAARTRARGFR